MFENHAQVENNFNVTPVQIFQSIQRPNDDHMVLKDFTIFLKAKMKTKL